MTLTTPQQTLLLEALKEERTHYLYKTACRATTDPCVNLDCAILYDMYVFAVESSVEGNKAIEDFSNILLNSAALFGIKIQV